jgi:hypothetical protein
VNQIHLAVAEDHKGRDNVGDPYINGRIIVKWTCEK